MFKWFKELCYVVGKFRHSEAQTETDIAYLHNQISRLHTDFILKYNVKKPSNDSVKPAKAKPVKRRPTKKK